jgi:hypothetical protein
MDDFWVSSGSHPWQVGTPNEPFFFSRLYIYLLAYNLIGSQG